MHVLELGCRLLEVVLDEVPRHLEIPRRPPPPRCQTQDLPDSLVSSLRRRAFGAILIARSRYRTVHSGARRLSNGERVEAEWHWASSSLGDRCAGQEAELVWTAE